MQQMSEGALAALRRAMGMYGPQSGDSAAGPSLDAGVNRDPMRANPVYGAQEPLLPPSAPAPSPAAPSPASPSALASPAQPALNRTAFDPADPVVARAGRILQEARRMGDVSATTLQTLVDELFSYLPEPQRKAITYRAIEMAVG